MTSPSDQMWNATTARPPSSTYPLPTLCSNGLEHARISAFQLRWKAWTKQKGRIRSDAKPSASLQMRDGKLYVVPGSGRIRIQGDGGLRSWGWADGHHRVIYGLTRPRQRHTLSSNGRRRHDRCESCSQE